MDRSLLQGLQASAVGRAGSFHVSDRARVSEALAVECSDIDFKNKTVLIKQTKFGSERRAHLPQSLIVVLANLARSNGPRSVLVRDPQPLSDGLAPGRKAGQDRAAVDA
jgi:integrase